jgi:hypothetical protein
MSPAAAAAAAAGLGMNPLQIQTAPSMTDLVDEEQSEQSSCWAGADLALTWTVS